MSRWIYQNILLFSQSVIDSEKCLIHVIDFLSLRYIPYRDRMECSDNRSESWRMEVRLCHEG